MKALNYSILPENYNKKTPKTLKVVADLLLLVSAIVVFLPEFTGQQWIMFIGSAFKLISKFISDYVEEEEITGVS